MMSRGAVVILTFLLQLAGNAVLKAQNEYGYLEIKGKVFRLDQPKADAEIIVYRNNRVFAKTKSDRKGRYSLKLEYFNVYRIEYKDPASFTTLIEIDTHIPKEYLPLWSTFSNEIPLFYPRDTFSIVSELNNPLALVSFVAKNKRFEDNRDLGIYQKSAPLVEEAKEARPEKPSLKKTAETPPEIRPEERNAKEKQNIVQNKNTKAGNEGELIREQKTNQRKIKSAGKENKIAAGKEDPLNKDARRKSELKKEALNNQQKKGNAESELMSLKAESQKTRPAEARPTIKKETRQQGDAVQEITKFIYSDHTDILIRENSKGKISYYLNQKPVTQRFYEQYIQNN